MADIIRVRGTPTNDRVASAVVLCLLAGIAIAVLAMGRHGKPEGIPMLGGAPAPAFPFPQTLAGCALEKTNSYNEANLYEYIDGQAPRYIQFGFRSLTVGQYRPSAPAAAPIVVDVYEMGTRRNAYGIWADGRSDEVEYCNIGNEGYASGNMAAFWRGGYFVQVHALTDKPAEEIVRNVAREAAGLIRDEIGGLEEFGTFPKEGQVAGSQVYLREAAFGLDFLDNVFAAEYPGADRNIRLFFTNAGSSEKAGDVLRKAGEFLRIGGTIENGAAPGEADTGVVWGNQRYFGAMYLTARGPLVAGIIGEPDKAAAAKRTVDLLTRASAELGKPTRGQQ